MQLHNILNLLSSNILIVCLSVLLIAFSIFIFILIKLMNKLQTSELKFFELEKKLAIEKEKYIEGHQSNLEKLNKQISGLNEQLVKQEAEFEKKLENTVIETRKKSNNKQRSVIKGQIGENFAPFMNGFNYNPSDCQFLGNPIDFIIFNNLHKCSSNEVDIEDVSIIFAEIKTGKSGLNKRQKIIQELIKRGQVKFETFRVDDSYPPNITSEKKNSSDMEQVKVTQENNSLFFENEKQLLEDFDKGMSTYKLSLTHKQDENFIRNVLVKNGRLK